ncbi:MAG: fatty acid desaturase family protein [Rhodospirillales bacterium]|nr:MAG: fatty acid desaturase family protein [Rhodospirillales bacterium]
MLPRPHDYLTSDQIARLRGKSDLVGAALVLHAWGLILGSMALFVWWPNPLTFVAAAMVIGARQLGLAILMHDAAHGLLFANRAVNDRVGEWLCAAPVGTSMALYRPYHLTHHRHTQQPEDPDLGLSAPFPISRASLWRKVLRDLSGRTAFQRRGEQIVRSMGPSDLPPTTRLANLLRRERGFFVTNAVLLTALAVAGHWWLYPALWLLPLATWYQLVSRIRNIAEHAVVPDDDDPLRNTRTTLANPVLRLLLAPYWVNYHLEHHVFLFVPCWRLPAAHRALLAGGFGPRMEFRRGYLEVLRMATSRLVDGPRDAARPRGAQHI